MGGSYCLKIQLSLTGILLHISRVIESYAEVKAWIDIESTAAGVWGSIIGLGHLAGRQKKPNFSCACASHGSYIIQPEPGWINS